MKNKTPMRIELLKTYLGHIVLLAKEYKQEKLSGNEEEEARQLEEKVQENESLSSYEADFLKAIWKIKINVFNELSYHSKMILDEFADENEDSFEIDQAKVEEAKKVLSEEEFELIGILYKLIVMQQRLEKKSKGKNLHILDLEPGFSDFMDSANSLAA